MKPAAATNVTDADVAAFLATGPDITGTARHLSIPGWGEAEWSILFSYTTATELQAGEVLIKQNAPDRSLFFATSGKLKVAVVDEADNSVSEIATIAPGSVVGEFAFFDGGPRSAKVWAVTHSRLLQLTLHDFERFQQTHLEKAAAFLFAMARLLAIRVRRSNERP
ncbi:MAG: Crp/Fnr family transcriptional regulator [Pseudomonadota bacterium]|nr:MAG: Crp/Fnr family transcriptional regulator [Pseudomonadota bacterium]